MALLSAQATDCDAVTVKTADLAAAIDKLTEAAALLDGLADIFERDDWPDKAADCRAMAAKLRGHTSNPPTSNPHERTPANE
jgi:hypothetical protein